MRRQISFTVEAKDKGQRLDVYLCHRLRSLSRTRIQQIIDENVSPKTLKAATLVRAGTVFTVDHETVDEPPPPALRVVYEDDAVLAIDKPSDLAVHPAGRHHAYTVTSALAAAYVPRPDPAHRIDRETSGLLICGRGKKATAALKQAFAEGRVQKSYLAVVEGWPAELSFEVDVPVQLGTGQVRVRMEAGRGKVASTNFQLERRFRDAKGHRFSLLHCMPRTGRQHQIRVHLAEVGLPLVGDKIYGSDETIFIRFTEGKLTDEDKAKLRLGRHALHAARIAFAHPTTGAAMDLQSALPEDLTGFLRTLDPV